MRIRDEAETQRKEGNLKPTSQANPRRRSVFKKYKSVKQKNVYKRKWGMKYETLKKNRQLIADSGNGVGYVHTGNGR